MKPVPGFAYENVKEYPFNSIFKKKRDKERISQRFLKGRRQSSR